MVAEQLRRRVPGGIGTYLRGLVRGLAALETDSPELTLWASRPLGRHSRDDDEGPGPERPGGAGSFERASVVTSPLPGPALVWGWDRGVGSLPVEADVVHAPSLTVPPAAGPPMSVTVHDLAWRRHPEAYTPRGRKWHEAALERALRRAALLVVPSRDTAEDLIGAGAAARRVEVVVEGTDHLPAPDHDAAAELLTRLGVPGRFLLSVSTLEPRKNLARVIEAYRSARARLPEGSSLLIVGPAGWGRSLPPIPAPEGVFLAGRVGDATLSALYERAWALVYVPLREGFGLPAVEAMRAGTPVIASPMPSTGTAALEVDPLDVVALGDALVRTVTDEGLRRQLIEAGHHHVAPLTWEAAARRHVELWESLL